VSNSLDGWIPLSRQLPPDKELVETKIDDALSGCRNHQKLRLHSTRFTHKDAPRPRQGPADGLPVSLPLLLREEAGKEANTGGRGQGVGGWVGWMEGAGNDQLLEQGEEGDAMKNNITTDMVIGALNGISTDLAKTMPSVSLNAAVGAEVIVELSKRQIRALAELRTMRDFSAENPDERRRRIVRLIEELEAGFLMNTIQLIRQDNGEPVRIWACGKCGHASEAKGVVDSCCAPCETCGGATQRA
jgi:rubrerythrin